MKIGVYNRWLDTLGGGERHSVAIAVHMARRHSVDFISHTTVDHAVLASRLDAEVSNIRFRAAPLQSSSDLGSLATQYDLFINASNAEFIPPLAKRNAMLVYFPSAPPVSPIQRMRRTIASIIDRLETQPRFLTGVYGLSGTLDNQVHELAQTTRIALPSASIQPYRVHFSLASVVESATAAILEIDGESVQTVFFRQLNENMPVSLILRPGGEHILTIHAIGGHGPDTPCLTMTPLHLTSRRARVYQRLFAEYWPELGVRLQNRLPAELRGIAEAYDLVWANSKYTQRWINAYWNLSSEVLYPPVPVERYVPGSKRPIILSVGRFFAGNHNKKHLVMVNAFRQLVDEGLRGWELHLVGGVTPGRQHDDYLNKVRNAAMGYPIRIHTDMHNAELMELRSASAIYWHAAGYGESPTRHPEKFEHFGLSVVEAMAAGCAPVVVGQGGLTELVRHERDGLLWYTTDELRSSTSRLVQDDALRSQMAQAAVVSSRRFSSASFEERLDRTLAPLMSR